MKIKKNEIKFYGIYVKSYEKGELYRKCKIKLFKKIK